MKTLWKTLMYPFQMIWNSIFDNNAHKIVSNKGQEVIDKERQKELLIKLMKHDEEYGMYDIDFSENSKKNLD